MGFAAAFETLKISNRFIESSLKECPMSFLALVYLASGAQSLSLVNKQKLIQAIGMDYLTPKFVCGFENNAAGLEKLINVVKLDFVGYYSNLLKPENLLNSVLTQNAIAFIQKATEALANNKDIVTKQITLSEAFSYVNKLFGQKSKSPNALKTSKASDCKVEQAIFAEDNLILDNFKKQLSILNSSNIFGDQRY
jgi:hypothetical protein